MLVFKKVSLNGYGNLKTKHLLNIKIFFDDLLKSINDILQRAISVKT